ncbi:MAG: hypothetical protein IJJ01_07475 [Firmicutes bacterium]|nr:hypothetical protein [Bacillota bacterium]
MIKYLKGYLDTDWRTNDRILYFLQHVAKIDINERELRDYFAQFNEKYESGDTEMFIAHSGYGYKLTSDPEEIMRSLEDDYKRSMKMLKRYYRCKRALSEKNQFALDQKETDLYEAVMRMGV